jgi:hypothetical protein
MTTRLPFTEMAVRRAIKAARKEGLPVTGTRIDPDGAITVYHAGAPVAPGGLEAHGSAPSKWEDVEA